MFGQYDLDQSTRLLWQQGPLDLLLSRSQRELWIAYRQSRPPLDETSHHEMNPISVPNEDGFVSRRFSLGEKEECTLEVTALTAPNPLVVKLKEPLTLIPRTETFVYVTTPLWVGFPQPPSRPVFLRNTKFRLAEKLVWSKDQRWRALLDLPNARDNFCRQAQELSAESDDRHSIAT